MDDDKLFQVGEYVQEFNDATGQALPCGPIYQSYGLKSHILKRHPNELDNLDHVPSIILDPDYIGKHPTEPDSIENVSHADLFLLAPQWLPPFHVTHK